MLKLHGCAVWVVLAGLAGTGSAQSGNVADLQEKLNGQFTSTKVTPDRTDIVTAGTVIILHKDGMVLYGVASPLPPSNSYKNGKIGQGWRGFGKDMAITMLAPGGTTAASYPQHKSVAEEKYWITGVQAQKDGILVQLYSDPVDGVRYYGNLKIVFPNKKELPTVDAALQELAEVVTVAPPDAAAAQPPAPPVQVAAAVIPDTPAPPKYDEVAPPPPPPAPAPTVSLGEPKAKVATDLGEPQRKAVMGTREIFYYSDPKMKITFTGGKVSNVE